MTAAGFASAETIELNVADATDFQGTEVPERPAGTNGDKDNGEAHKWQPLQSCKIGDYAFAFSTTSETANQQPAYYSIMSTATSGTPNLRLYNGTTMTITAPEGVNITNVEFTGSNAGKNLAVTATTGKFTLNGNNGTWTGSANSFSLTVSATWRVSKLVITTGEGGETPVDPTPENGTLYEEAFSNTQGDFTVENIVKPEEVANIWTTTAAYGMKATAYVNNTNYASDSWLISPVLDFTSASELVLTFEQVLNFFTSVDVAKEEATVCARVEGGEWVKLSPAYPESLSWAFVPSGNIDLSAFDGKKMQVGFHYTSGAKAGTWEIKNLKITGKGNPITPVDPDPTPGDESTKENPYTVAQAIALGSDYKKAVWVKGFIVGYVNGQAYADGCVFGNTAPEGAEVSKTNILIAGSKDETDINNCMPVQLPAGAERDALNLNANPTNLGKELTINGNLTKYFNVPGLRKEGDATYEYVLDGQGSEPVNPPVVEKAKFVKAAAIESGKKYLLVADGKAATGKVKNDAAYGYLLVEAVTIEGDVASAPADYGFTISAVEGAYTIQRPDGTYVAMKGTYNSFNFYASPEEWYEWVISINNDGTADIWNSDADKYVAYDAQYSSYGCYPEEKAETCIKPTLYVLDEGQSGVAEIVIDENAPVEYFNIQGVKVDVENAAPGLYIRRQGNVATKVIVK